MRSSTIVALTLATALACKPKDEGEATAKDSGGSAKQPEAEQPEAEQPKAGRPAPRWSVAAPFEVWDLVLAEDGRVGIVGERSVALVRDGQVVWQADLDKSNFQVEFVGDCLLTANKGELRCYDDAGQVTWALPPVEGGGAWLGELAVGPGDALTVIGEGGEILRIDTAACADDPKACVESIATVPSLEGAHIHVFPNGVILGNDDHAGATLVSSSGEVLATRNSSGAKSKINGEVLIVGTELLKANPGCSKGADDCFSLIATSEEFGLATQPVEIPGVGVAYVAELGYLNMVGAKPWKVRAGTQSSLLGDAELIYSVGRQIEDAEPKPPQLRAIDAQTGETKWMISLGTKPLGILDECNVDATADAIAIACEELFLVPLGD